MSQLDLICADCPLADCSEESLWCARRFLSRPNKAQIALMTPAVRKLLRKRPERSEYFAAYYLAKRDKKLAAANARNAAPSTNS